ncbi:AfsR/SARP family transcriptional regulator [Eubacterium ramulus]
MNEKTAILNVRMLGDFSITYDGRQVSFGKNTTTKAMKLLQILIYYGEQGIAREKLLNALYVREELADAANNLRVTAHRLKKMIIDAGLPEYDYIVIKKGVYRWNAPVPTIVDARKFQELYEEAQNCADTKQKEELLKQVCNMYRGEFLPEISGDEWVLLESVQYKKLYSNALKELCDGLIEKCDYEEALLFCEPACRLYPFDEWQSIKIECFLGMKRYKEAMKEYDDTAKLFFEELGISPSERLMEQFDQMSSQLKHVKPKEIQDIKQRLKEEKGQGGAYYCSLPSFRDSYRLVTRMLERSGQSAYLMLCSLTDGKGHPLEKPEKLELLSEELQNTIQHCLRKGDSFTKYSPSQYLVLLIGTNKENCGLIFDRIRKYFAREHRSWNKYVEFYVSSVAEWITWIPRFSSEMMIAAGSNIWKRWKRQRNS